MKQKEYVSLLTRIQELVYEVSSLTQYVYDNEYASSKYGETLKERKEELDSLMSNLEEIMSVDAQEFNSAFMKYLNDDSYELTQVTLEGSKVHVAKPKDLVLEDGRDLLKDGVYILSVDDRKILSKPTCKIGNGSLPVVSIVNRTMKDIYFAEYTKYNRRYDRFVSFMGGAEAKAIKNFESKKGFKR